ncbi:KpsF/GutQ family sugar-phosphate isomerase [Microvirga roseola]|uniref:KpsF/GutQ family sugar-phosphate isomerase n=1 Tax=Microvirga roseola TaxID=2883126 RepID=UPI001E63CC71|nr:KpsF/GutQ family sugar-phosphate isomerase [Microvirga roseola]
MVASAIQTQATRLPSQLINAGRKALQAEIQGLELLSQALGVDFESAVTTLEAISGRVIVTGMGKSGHVGRKIAATFASTGTPSFFVHPGEASHGDLGMIGKDDAVVALSNSGETSELSDIVAYTRRMAIPLIAITGRPGSTLARNSDVALILPLAPEACPLGLAPTTSTTMTLALGDALAVALLEQRGFTAADFRLFHPGGKLGQRLLKVVDLMHVGEEIPLCSVGTSMSEVLMIMTGRRFGCVGVQNQAGKLVGIVTDGDLRRHMGGNLLDQLVEDVMTQAPVSVLPGALAASALEVMNSRGITTLFVVDDDSPVGVLHVHDLLRAGIA